MMRKKRTRALKAMAAESVLVILVTFIGSVAVAETPPLRLLRFNASDAKSARQWQQSARMTLAVLLKMDDQIAWGRNISPDRKTLALNPKTISAKKHEKYTRYELQIDSRPDRRIAVVLTVPRGATRGKTPAVVCIHGHGGSRAVVYDSSSIYGGFASVLAEKGYVTLSTDVGQHEVQSKHRSLMGERLWDLMRLVDLAVSRPEVDAKQIDCAGLSLGGEMAMWLGAMDTRIAATVSSGFLTTMENLRVGHCQCWDFPGLQRRYDFADIYSLISPRPLECQNGQKERLPGGFPINLAEVAMTDIKRAYRAYDAEQAAQLATHPEGHVLNVPSAVRFFDTTLGRSR